MQSMDMEWLKAQLELHPDKNKAGLARALRLEPSAVSKMLNGRRQIKAQEYVAMRRFFGLPVERSAVGPAANAGNVVLEPLRTAGLGERETAQESGQWVMPASLFEHRTKAAPDQVKIFAVHGDAMSPDFMPGEQVLVDLSDRSPSPPGVFVVSDGLGYILRQCEYVPHSSPPSVRLAARNSRYQPYETALDKAEITGRVIAKLQWI